MQCYLNIYLVSRTPADLGLTPESLLPPSLLPGTDFGLGADILLDSVEIQTLDSPSPFCVTYNWRYILQVRVGADGYLNLCLLIINCFETKVFWSQNQMSKIKNCVHVAALNTQIVSFLRFIIENFVIKVFSRTMTLWLLHKFLIYALTKIIHFVIIFCIGDYWRR